MILNVIFISMMFGTGLPILFPIALAFFWLLYVTEKFLLYYGYREPPHYDEVLNDSVLKFMYYAPLLSLSFSYWMLSNKQLVENGHLTPKTRKGVPYQCNHYVRQVFVDGLTNPAYLLRKQGPAGVLLLVFTFYLMYIIVKSVFSKQTLQKARKKLGLLNSEAMFEGAMDENIDSYHKCLDDDDRSWTIKEEENCRNIL